MQTGDFSLMLEKGVLKEWGMYFLNTIQCLHEPAMS